MDGPINEPLTSFCLSFSVCVCGVQIDGCTTLKNLLEASGLNNPQLTGRGVFWPYHYMGNDYRSNQQVGFLTNLLPETHANGLAAQF